MLSRITSRNRADVPMCAGLLPAPGLFDEMSPCRVLDVWSSKNLDTQEDYWDKIGTLITSVLDMQ